MRLGKERGVIHVTAPSASASLQRGFSYLVLLFVVAVFGVGLGVVVPVWSEVMKQDREIALVERGNAIVRGLRSYATASATGKRLPTHLAELLEDRRDGNLRRHLRAIPPDPVMRSATWGLILDKSGGILGVRSLSKDKPLRDGLPEGAVGPSRPTQYDDWQFLMDPSESAVASSQPTR